MSSENFEALKQQIKNFTAAEKSQLFELLREQLESSDENGAASPSDASPEDKRQKRAAWLKANRERYGGQYVALDGDRLLGTGKNYPEAYEHAQRAGVKNAFVDYLSKPGEVGFMGGW